jgi:hypothetical protein
MYRYITGLMVILMPLVAEARLYQQCGTDRQQILHDLAQQIYVKVQSQLQQQVTVSEEKSSQSSQLMQRVESNVRLQGITWQVEAGQSCASVTSESLAKQWNATARQAVGYRANDLPQDNRQRASLLDRWLDDIAYVVAAYNALAEEVEIPADQSATTFLQQMNQRFASLSDERSRVKLQYVRIIVEDEAPPRVNINNRRVESGNQVWLDVGSHSWSAVSHDAKFSRTGTIDLAESGMVEIKVDFAAERSRSAVISGATSALSATGGAVASGLSWITETKDEAALIRVGRAYKDRAQRIEIGYSMARPEDHWRDWQSPNAWRLTTMTYGGAVRFGYGVSYGEKEEGQIVEVFGSGMLHLTSIGAKGVPFHLRSIAIIPALGVDIGAGRHTLYRQGQTLSNFSTSGDAAENTQRDNLIVRGKLAADIVLMPELALVIGYEWNYRMDKARGVYYALNFKF